MPPRSKPAALTAVLLVCIGALTRTAHVTADPKGEETLPRPMYHKDREHLWNRVHAALLLRIGPDGRSYGGDRLEPLLWNDSRYLLRGKTADQVVDVLDEFVRNNGETLINDPLKRAVLQRDLWLVSNWLIGKPDDDRKRLAAVLARVIRRLALTPEQIARLPDNYAAAVASKRYAAAFTAERPDQSYLPAGLFETGGPWVCIGRTDGPTAPFHLREDPGGNRFTNSAFLIFLKLPGGRDKTLEFLKALAAFDKPLVLPNTDERTKRLLAFLPNPAVPQWPKGTEVALVRKAMLIDSSRRVVVSPLAESIQLRVMHTDAPALTADTIDRIAGRKGTGGQAFAEFQLRRATLFEGKPDGLSDVSGERDFKTGFNAHPWDEFERAPNTDRPFPQQALPFANNRASCVGCHSPPGVYSFNSVQGFEFGIPRLVRTADGEERKPHVLAAMSTEKAEKAAVEWKEGQPGWAALRKLMPE